MASFYEPMDVDEVDLDDKENAFRHNGPGGPARTPTAEKGYEELDVSELNMQLRLSCTPLASPTPPPRRFTGTGKKLFLESGDNSALNLTITCDNANAAMNEWSMGDHNENLGSQSEQDMTNSTVNSETGDENKNTTVFHQNADLTISDVVNHNETITLEPSHRSEQTSSPSMPIEITPFDTTPTKEMPKTSTSPIMRGLKSVLSIFRPAQSPITPVYNSTVASDNVPQDNVSPVPSINQDDKPVLVSTPVQGVSDSKRAVDQSSSRSSSQIPDSIVFNEDLVNELQWNDDFTIVFNKNKLPYSMATIELTREENTKEDNLPEFTQTNKAADTTVEYMDISVNDSNLQCDRVHSNTENEVEDLKISKQAEVVPTIVIDDESDFDTGSVSLHKDIPNTSGSENQIVTHLKSTACVNETESQLSRDIVLADEVIKSQTDIKVVEDTVEKRMAIEDSEQEYLKAFEPSKIMDIHNNEVSVAEKQEKSQFTSDVGENVPLAQCTHVTSPNIIFNPNVTDITIEMTEKILNKTCNKESIESEEIPTPVNNSPYMSLNAPQGPQDLDVSSVAMLSKLDFDSIENPFATKSRVSTTPPQSDINFDEIKNPFATKPRISTSPLRNTSINSFVINTNNETPPRSSDIDKLSQSALDTYKIDRSSDMPNALSQYKESITLDIANEVSNPDEDENLTIILDSISTSTPSGSNIINSNESQEQSDAYLSADSSGRESEQLLDSELEMIDKHRQNETNKNSTTNGEHYLENLFENKTSIKMSPTVCEIPSTLNEISAPDCENPFATKSKISISPPLPQHDSLQNIQTFIDNENPFVTKSKVRMSPTLQDIHSPLNAKCANAVATDSDIYILSPQANFPQKNNDQVIVDSENIFQTKNTMEMSPMSDKIVSTLKARPVAKSKNVTTATSQLKSQKTKDSPAAVNENQFEITSEDTVNNLTAECENPFTTKTKIRMSPPSVRKNVTSPMTNEEPIIENINKFDTNHERRLSVSIENISIVNEDISTVKTNEKYEIDCQNHISQMEEETTKLEDENPFVTKTKLRMSPSPVDGEIVLIAKDIPLTKNNIHTSPLTHSDTQAEIEEPPIGYVENAFTTNTKVNISPCGNLEFEEISGEENMLENPFATKIKIRMSPPLLEPVFIPPSKQSVELSESKKEQVSSENEFVNHQSDRETTFLLPSNMEAQRSDNTSIAIPNIHEQSLVRNISENDATISSEGSNVSSNNITIKDVKTEDEDTAEGPDFVGLDEITEGGSTPVSGENSGSENKSPKVTICSDMTTALPATEDVMPDEEFLECTNEEFQPGELFINADTFDFLMNKNTAIGGIESRESLFLKFDPLCANKRNSSGVVSVPVNIEIGTEGDKTQQPEIIQEDAALMERKSPTPVTPGRNSVHIPGYPLENESSTKDQYNVTAYNSTPPEKPMMAVMPAINNDQIINTRSTPYTPTRPERRSMTFASPAIAAIDRLISLSGNNSPANQTYYMENTGSGQESNEAVLQLRDLLAEKESEVEQLKLESKRLGDRLTDLEIQMKSLQDDNDERLQKLDDLKAKLAHKTALNKNMASVVEEYERAISGMIGENEQEKQRHEREKADLIRERDEQVAHLNSMEVSFSDLHTKYERTKQVILTYKANEEALRKAIHDYKESQLKLENNYEVLKQQAIGKLNNANAELDKIKRSHEAEVLKLTAQVKRKELHATSLEESLAQKTKANEELTAICDELISKVG